MKLTHKLAHLFGTNTGHVYSWWDSDRLMIGFRCDGCDVITGVHPTYQRRKVHELNSRAKSTT